MQEYLRNSLKTGHVICISEGSAEEVVIKKLFNSNTLIFKSEDIYTEDGLIRDFSRTRKSTKFAKEHLEMDYGDKHINILRILDSKTEKFNLGRIYEERVESKEIRIFNILTRPEIEMLIIINAGYYDNFTHRGAGRKPSLYCKEELDMKDVKSEKFVSGYFYDIEKLIDSIKEYRRLHAVLDEYCLFDLLD